MERADYEGGICPCCGTARAEYYVFRAWTCSDCDSWLVGVGHGFPLSNGNAGWHGLGRFPLGPMDDVPEAMAGLFRHAVEGRLGDPRRLAGESDL